MGKSRRLCQPRGKTATFMTTREAHPDLLGIAGGTRAQAITPRSWRQEPAPSGADYLLEPGWKADAAIQGLRSATNPAPTQPAQKPPLFRPVATDVKARGSDSSPHIAPPPRHAGGHHARSAPERRKQGGCSGPRTTSRALCPRRPAGPALPPPLSRRCRGMLARSPRRRHRSQPDR